MSIFLRAEHLTKRFGPITAVKDLSFQIEEGQVYGILGPNGSGKSTTLGMVLNVINPTKGHYQWFDGSMDTAEALKKIGAIIEHPNFYPYMTAVQNLKLVCKIKEISSDKIDEKLAVVGLLERKNSLFQTFSLGMKQRLAIASALLNEPKVLIFDEPTNGLDPEGIHQIREIIQNIATTGTTILLASHLLSEVEKICSHVIIISKGKKLYEGRVDEMSADHGYFELKTDKPDELIELLKQDIRFGKLKNDEKKRLITAFLNESMEAGELNSFLHNKGIVLAHLVKRKESLEKRFLDITKQQN